MENQTPAPVSPPPPVDAPTGTLMWVGARDLPEFQQAFAFCEQHAAQLALRRDLVDALKRPATAVNRIVLVQRTRAEVDCRMEQRLSTRYPDAAVVRLLGPLCAGESPGCLQPFGLKRLYWHQANQVLPGWFQAEYGTERLHNGIRRSVAVIAATEAVAEPLLDLADSAGAAAVWCRQADRFRVRNVDVFWWDDSAAPPVSPEAWRQRIASTQNLPPRGRDHDAESPVPVGVAPRHAWLAGSPTLQQHRDARTAGVSMVITKPAQIQPLVAMLADVEPSHRHDRPAPIPQNGAQRSNLTAAA